MEVRATRLVVDGRPVSVPAGASLLDACRAAGAEVPSLCHMDGLPEVASCRACLVEVAVEGGAGDGAAGATQRLPACATPATDGMRVATDTPALRRHRHAVAAMLFASGHHVCAFCPASGRCALQDLGRMAGLDEAGLDPELAVGPLDASRSRFALDPARCILCTRCVRVCAFVEGAHAMGIAGRGAGSHVVFDGASWGESRACTDCGRCAEACPTGAIVEKALAPQGIRARHTLPTGWTEAASASMIAEDRRDAAPQRRLRLATAWLGGCSGCHMSLLDLDERLLDLAPAIDLVHSPLSDAKAPPDAIDACLVEGAVSTDEDEALLRRLRDRSRLLVALGDCAVTGNVTAMRDLAGGARAVLARSWPARGHAAAPGGPLPVLLDRVRPLREVVPVDLSLPGCPPSPGLIHRVLAGLVAGRLPPLGGLVHFG